MCLNVELILHHQVRGLNRLLEPVLGLSTLCGSHDGWLNVRDLIVVSEEFCLSEKILIS